MKKNIQQNRALTGQNIVVEMRHHCQHWQPQQLRLLQLQRRQLLQHQPNTFTKTTSVILSLTISTTDRNVFESDSYFTQEQK